VLPASLFGQPPSGCTPPQGTLSASADPSSAAWNNEAGAWFARQGNTRCAINLFENALRADPHSKDARYNLGIALLEDHQLDRAAKELELAVGQTPDSVKARLALGTVRQDLGDLTRAEAEFRAALKLDAKSAAALHYLGVDLTEQRRYNAAITYLRDAPRARTI